MSTLIITADDLDPERVTRLLGITPQQSWKKGELQLSPRKQSEMRDNVIPLNQSRYPWGGWKFFSDPSLKEAEIEDHIRYWCDLLLPKVDSLQTLVEQECRVEINCCIIGDCEGVEFEPEILSVLGQLHTFVSITFYASLEGEQDEGPQSGPPRTML